MKDTPLHDPQRSNLQVPHHTPPWNQNVYTPCYQPYEPSPPYTPPQYPHPHDIPPNHTTFFPIIEPLFPPKDEVLHPLLQEQQDLQAFFQEQEGFRKKQGEFIATIAESVNRFALLCSTTQDIPLEEGGGSSKECREEENMEPQGKEETLGQELQQEEKDNTSESEEVNGDLREFDQEVDSIINDFLSTLVNPLNDLEEPSTLEFEREREELEKRGEEEVITQEVEAFMEEPNRITPTQGQIEWVTISSMNFTGPHQFAILETDHQLKALLGVLNIEGVDVGFPRNSRHKWCKVHLGGFQDLIRCSKGAWRGCSSKGTSQSQQEDDRETKVWDPGIHLYNQQFWIPISCLRLLESLMYFVSDPRGFLKSKHGWQLKDGWKHKPP
ncbi:hypothetical protein Ahy_B05g077727 [Arachis hypogaea]|uniref:Uncharacterized protein n=1 Tax=Arachis hypogaea TaxID=3818 RepID=A0A444Z5B4_ARAHY|nr:hypothetical protein Ahy_B05g077727 [Arachis hypogaea]